MAGRCNASQDAQDAWDAGDASLASGRNADGSDAGSVFADGACMTFYMTGSFLVVTEALSMLRPRSRTSSASYLILWARKRGQMGCVPH